MEAKIKSEISSSGIILIKKELTKLVSNRRKVISKKGSRSVVRFIDSKNNSKSLFAIGGN